MTTLNYRIKGTLINTNTNMGIEGFYVDIYKGISSSFELASSVVTDKKGAFAYFFTKLDTDPLPNMYFIIKDPYGNEIMSTKDDIMYELQAGDNNVSLKLDLKIVEGKVAITTGSTATYADLYAEIGHLGTLNMSPLGKSKVASDGTYKYFYNGSALPDNEKQANIIVTLKKNSDDSSVATSPLIKNANISERINLALGTGAININTNEYDYLNNAWIGSGTLDSLETKKVIVKASDTGVNENNYAIVSLKKEVSIAFYQDTDSNYIRFNFALIDDNYPDAAPTLSHVTGISSLARITLLKGGINKGLFRISETQVVLIYTITQTQTQTQTNSTFFTYISISYNVNTGKPDGILFNTESSFTGKSLLGTIFGRDIYLYTEGQGNSGGNSEGKSIWKAALADLFSPSLLWTLSGSYTAVDESGASSAAEIATVQGLAVLAPDTILLLTKEMNSNTNRIFPLNKTYNANSNIRGIKLSTTTNFIFPAGSSSRGVCYRIKDLNQNETQKRIQMGYIYVKVTGVDVPQLVCEKISFIDNDSNISSLYAFCNENDNYIMSNVGYDNDAKYDLRILLEQGALSYANISEKVIPSPSNTLDSSKVFNGSYGNTYKQVNVENNTTGNKAIYVKTAIFLPKIDSSQRSLYQLAEKTGIEVTNWAHFIKAKTLIAASSNNKSLEQYLNKYKPDNTGWYDGNASNDALFVKSYCAKNINITTIKYISSPITTTGDWAFDFDFIHDANVYSFIIGFGGLAGIGIGYPNQKELIYFDGTNYSYTGALIESGIKYNIKVSHISGTLKMYINGVDTAFTNSGTPVYRAITNLRLGARSDSDRAMQGRLWNVKVYSGTGAVTLAGEYRLAGSPYDSSANGNHGTNVNGLDLQGAQDCGHLNLINGCDVYRLDGSFTDRTKWIYVPYVNGTPVVSSIANYTKYRSCPPTKYGLTGCETQVRMPDFGDDIWDKSDTNVWSANVRGSLYDSTNPRDWYYDELVQDYINENISTNYRNRIFISWRNNAVVDNTTKLITSGTVTNIWEYADTNSFVNALFAGDKSDFFYGLFKLGISTDYAEIISTDREKLHTTLTEAVTKKIINRTQDEITAFIAALLGTAAAKMETVTSEGGVLEGHLFKKLLHVSGVTTEATQNAFLTGYLNKTESMEDYYTHCTLLTTAEKTNFKLVTAFSAITANTVAMVQHLYNNKTTYSSVKKLTDIKIGNVELNDAASWANMVNPLNVDYPGKTDIDAIPSSDPLFSYKDQLYVKAKREFISGIVKKVENMFPTIFLHSQINPSNIGDAESTHTLGTDTRNALGTLITKYTQSDPKDYSKEFDLYRDNIKDKCSLIEPPIILDPLIIQNLEKIQRLYRVAGINSRPGAVEALYTLGFSSAADIVNAGKNAFLEAFGTVMATICHTGITEGVTPQEGDIIVGAISGARGRILVWNSSTITFNNNNGIQFIKGEPLYLNVTAIKFAKTCSGGTGTSTCYFNDNIPDFLFSRDEAIEIYKKAEKISMLSVLAFSLSKGFNNAMPLSVAFNKTSGETSKLETLFGNMDAWDIDHDDSVIGPSAYLVDLLAFVKGANNSIAFSELTRRRPDILRIKLNKENTTTVIPYIDLVNEILENAVAGTAIVDQTDSTTKEIDICPEHINELAYSELSKKKYPYNFNLWDKEFYALIDHLGIDLTDLMASAKWPNYILRLNDTEKNMLTSSTLPLTDYYGPDSNPPVLLESLKHVAFLLQRARITYEELNIILKTKYVNPSNVKVDYTHDNQHQPDLDKAYLNFLEPDFIKLRKFILLQRKLGWDFYDVDRAIRTLGSGTISDTMLDSLSRVMIMKKKVKNISLSEIFTWWSDIDTYEYPEIGSFYNSCFAGKALLAFSEDKKILTLFDNDFVRKASYEISSEAIVNILSGILQITAEDYKLLLQNELNNMDFSFKNVSRLYRVASFCRHFNLSIEDYESMVDIFGLRSATYKSSQSDLSMVIFPAFAERIEMMNYLGISANELRFIASGDNTAYLSQSRANEEASQMLNEIRPELKDILSKSKAENKNEAALTYLASKFASKLGVKEKFMKYLLQYDASCKDIVRILSSDLPTEDEVISLPDKRNLEQCLTKYRSDNTGWHDESNSNDALFVKSYCAEFAGAGLVTIPHIADYDFGTGNFEFGFDCCLDPANPGGTLIETTGTSFISVKPQTTGLQVYLADNFPANYVQYSNTTTVFFPNATTWASIRILRTGGRTLAIYLNGTNVTTTFNITGNGSTDFNITNWNINKIGNGASGFGKFKIRNFYVKNAAGIKIGDYPFQGSCYDVSTKNNHGIINLTVNLQSTQDNFHYNLLNGCDVYFLNSAPTDRTKWIYVPYANGIPVVSSITGYTKVRSCPATNKGLTGCETQIRMPKFGDDLWDKSDISIWSTNVRGSLYDSADPRDWRYDELVQEYIDANMSVDYKGRILIGRKNAVVDNTTKLITSGTVKDILEYKEPSTSVLSNNPLIQYLKDYKPDNTGWHDENASNDAAFVKSYCVTGGTGKSYYESNTTFDTASNWSLYAAYIADLSLTADFLYGFTIDGNYSMYSSGGIRQINSGVIGFMYWDGSTYQEYVSTATVSSGALVHLFVSWENSTKTVTMEINGIVETHAFATAMPSRNNYLCILNSRSRHSAFNTSCKSKVLCCGLWTKILSVSERASSRFLATLNGADTAIVFQSLNGVYDISGNHRVFNTIGTPVYTTQNIYHRNLNYGCDVYYLASAAGDRSKYAYVPYDNNQVAVKTESEMTALGYTKIRSCPPIKNGLTGCETQLRMPELGCDLWDKSDSSVWSTNVRGSLYDSANPRDWRYDELVQEYINTNISVANKDCIQIGRKDAVVDDTTKLITRGTVKDVMAYRPISSDKSLDQYLKNYKADNTGWHDENLSNDAAFVKSYCSCFDGGYISVPHHNDFNIGTANFKLSCYLKAASLSTNGTFIAYSGANANGISFSQSEQGLLIYLIDSYPTNYIKYYKASGLITNTTKWYKLEIIRTGLRTLQIFLDDVNITASMTKEDIGSGNITVSSTADFRMANGSSGAWRGSIYNVYMKNASDNYIANWPLQGSMYDISGNAHHGTISGTVVSLKAIQNNFHYNLLNGCNIWYDGTSHANDIYVPYVNGSVLSGIEPINNYTKYRSCPPIKNGLTGCETQLRMPEFGSDLWDKSDSSVWSTNVRGSLYDSANPRDWRYDELVQEYIDANISADYKNRIHIGRKDASIDSTTKLITSGTVKDVLEYSTLPEATSLDKETEQFLNNYTTDNMGWHDDNKSNDAMFVKSYCAQGATGTYSQNATVFDAGTTIVSCNFNVSSLASDNPLIVGINHQFILRTVGDKVAIHFLLNGGNKQVVDTHVLSLNTNYRVIAYYSGSTVGIKLDNSAWVTDALASYPPIANTKIRIGYDGAVYGANYLNGKIWNVGICSYSVGNLAAIEAQTLSTTTYSLLAPCAGSGLDISGNNRHFVNTGGVVNYQGTQDNFHYNLLNGCDVYSLNSAPTDRTKWIYVPYVSGVPVVSSITGYTKVRSCPATNKGLTGCETQIRMPKFGDDLWDKSDISIWSTNVRGSLYDSANPRDWRYDELVQEYIDTNMSVDYKGRILIGRKNAVVDNSTKLITSGTVYEVSVVPEQLNDKTEEEDAFAYRALSRSALMYGKVDAAEKEIDQSPFAKAVTGNICLDLASPREDTAQPGYCAKFLDSTSCITFPDNSLTGLVISSKSDNVYIVGNTIKATTTEARVYDVTLKNASGNIVAYFPLDGSTYDVSGNNFHPVSITNIALLEQTLQRSYLNKVGFAESSQMLTNGSFDDGATAWSYSPSGVTFTPKTPTSSGYVTLSSATWIRQGALTPGKVYRCVIEYNISSGQMIAGSEASLDANNFVKIIAVPLNVNGKVEFYFHATTTNFKIAANGSARIDSVSIYETFIPVMMKDGQPDKPVNRYQNIVLNPEFITWPDDTHWAVATTGTGTKSVSQDTSGKGIKLSYAEGGSGYLTVSQSITSSSETYCYHIKADVQSGVYSVIVTYQTGNPTVYSGLQGDIVFSALKNATQIQIQMSSAGIVLIYFVDIYKAIDIDDTLIHKGRAKFDAKFKNSFCAEFAEDSFLEFVEDINGEIAYDKSGDIVVNIDPLNAKRIKKISGSGAIWNLRLPNGAIFPLQGSCYDISGNGFNVVTNNNVNLLARQDTFHYNLTKGFGEGANLIADSDCSGAGLDSWIVSTADASSCVKEAASGKNYIKIERAGAATTTRISQNLKDLACSGKVYKLEFNYRQLLTTTVEVQLNGTPVVTCAPTFGWNSVICYFQTRATGAGDLTISFVVSSGVSSQAMACLSDIRISEAWIPMLQNMTGYAADVSSAYPASEYWHNGAETGIDFSGGATIPEVNKYANFKNWSGAIFEYNDHTAGYMAYVPKVDSNNYFYWWCTSLTKEKLELFSRNNVNTSGLLEFFSRYQLTAAGLCPAERKADPSVSDDILRKFYIRGTALSKDTTADDLISGNRTIADLADVLRCDPVFLNDMITLNSSTYNISSIRGIDKLVKAGTIQKLTGCTRSDLTLWLDLNYSEESSAKNRAETIKKAVRQKYTMETWNALNKKLHDKLREERRDALQAYCLINITTIYKAGGGTETVSFKEVKDLYNYFLIDTEMNFEAKTSRIKLALSAVQLFVQRCLLNLEKYNSIPITFSEDAAEEWKWRKNYRVWEANRKIFLYPENWIEPELRLDKTEIFKNLEDEIMQNDLSAENAETAYLNYLESLHDVSHLELCGFCKTPSDDAGNDETLCVFARTKEFPYHYYWRKWENGLYWTGWEQIPLSIEGDHLIPVFHNRRIYLIWPKFISKTIPAWTKTEIVLASSTESSYSERKYFDIKICWSEYRNKKWSPTKESKLDISADFEMLISRIEGFHLNGLAMQLKLSYSYTEPQKSYFAFIPKKEEKGQSDTLIGQNRYDSDDDTLNLYVVYYNYEKDNSSPGSDKKLLETYYGTKAHFTFNEYNNSFEADPNVEWKSYGNLANNKLFVRQENQKLISNITLQTQPYLSSQLPGLLFKAGEGYKLCILPDNNYLTDLAPFFYEDKNHTLVVMPENADEEYISDMQMRSNIIDLNMLVLSGINVSLTLKNKILLPSTAQVFLKDKNLYNWKDDAHISVADEVFFKAGNSSDTNQVFDRSSSPATQGYFDANTNKKANSGSLNLQSYEHDFNDSSRKIQLILDNSTSTAYPYSANVSSPACQQYAFYSFEHPFTRYFIKAVNKYGVPALLSPKGNTSPLLDALKMQKMKKYYFSQYMPTSFVKKGTVIPGTAISDAVAEFTDYPKDDIDFSVHGAYSLYNWELFFHAPFMIAKRLMQNQKFEEARQWFHYIFDPTQSEGNSPERYWKLRPFAEAEIYTLPELLDKLNSGNAELEKQIAIWQDNPFQPHIIAKLRITAYMKAVVMAYIDNLIDWADMLFRRDTIETINEAAQLYILAAELLGARPNFIKAEEKTDKAYVDFGSLDAISNCDTDPELFVIDSNPIRFGSIANKETNPYKLNIHPLLSILNAFKTDTTHTNLYFGIPKNEKLLAYWDTVADRLFKIRNSMNIEGVKRQLPLFEPPIDPMLLVKAVASGLSIADALMQIQAPLPNYRFSFMLQKAKELCSDVKALGGEILQALEKKDAEMIALLRNDNEIELFKAIRSIKESNILEANDTVLGLQKSLEIAQTKINHYKTLTATKNQNETDALYNLGESISNQEKARDHNIAAAAILALPDIFIGFPTSGITYGFRQVAEAISIGTKVYSHYASIDSIHSQRNSINASYDRRLEEWNHQLELATKESEQIDKQILAANIRKSIAENDLKNQDLQIEQSQEVLETMKNRFTNQELYQWMISKLSGIYFQAYSLAYDVAQKAERCYRFELDIPEDEKNIIDSDCWDSLKKGLLAGERLTNALHRLELAYMEKNKRTYEITKNISLAMINPEALISLKATGSCNFSIPEILYDLEYPGQYLRKIKSVSLSIPCVTGPYTNVPCKLTLYSSKIRTKPFSNDELYLKESFVSTQSIATSAGRNDSGMFEFNFRDDRYLPFEGAGAVSDWLVELPSAANLPPFDYSTISDIILTINYTAKDDGAFRQTVESKIKAALNTFFANNKSLPLLISLNEQFANELHIIQTCTCTPPVTTNIVIKAKQLPVFLKNKAVTVNTTVDVYVKRKAGATVNPTFTDLSVTLINGSDWYKGSLAITGGTVGDSGVTIALKPASNNGSIESMYFILNLTVA